MAMRFDGTLKKWNAERGFGFIMPTEGGQELFVHVSAFPRDGRLPLVGEPLSFEVAPDREGRKRAVQVRRPGAEHAVSPYVPQRTHRPTLDRSPKGRSGTGFGARLVGLILLAALGAYAYNHYSQYTKRIAPLGLFQSDPAMPSAPATPPGFRCDGRTHCSQMTSCAEAMLFLKNCPGVKMDGNNDGVPCEQQWCTSPFAK